MNLWTAVLAACLLAFALKYSGYVIPERWLAHPVVSATTAALPVALLAALVATQTVVGEMGAIVLDARLVAVAVALVALALRAPFIVVVLLGAGAAAGLRALGLS